MIDPVSPDELLHDSGRFPREGGVSLSDGKDSEGSSRSSNSMEESAVWSGREGKGGGSGTVRQFPHGSTLLHQPTVNRGQMTIKDIDELAGTIRLSELEASLDLEMEKEKEKEKEKDKDKDKEKEKGKDKEKGKEKENVRVSDVLRGSFMDEMLEEAMKDV